MAVGIIGLYLAYVLIKENLLCVCCHTQDRATIRLRFSTITRHIVNEAILYNSKSHVMFDWDVNELLLSVLRYAASDPWSFIYYVILALSPFTLTRLVPGQHVDPAVYLSRCSLCVQGCFLSSVFTQHRW